MNKEEFRILERKYNLWLSKHPKGDYNYKSFSHMRRSVEFAKAYADEQNEGLAKQSAKMLGKYMTAIEQNQKLVEVLKEAREDLNERDRELNWMESSYALRLINEILKETE